MTIAAAWRQSGAVFVVADSLKTYMGPGRMPLLRADSTFTEPTLEGAGRSEETGCKIFDLGAGVVATLAGEAQPGLLALIGIRNRLRYGRSLREAVSAVGEVKGAKFRLLVGRGDGVNTELFLVRSDGTAEEIYEELEPIVLGSLPPAGKEWIERTVKLVSKPGDAESTLAAVLMSLQSFGRRIDLRKDGAGGAFFGMHSENGTVSRQRDVFYVVSTKDGFLDAGPFDTALVGIRDEALFAWPLGKPTAVYVSDVGTGTDSEIERKLRESLSPGFQPPFICLIERNVGALMAVDHRRSQSPSLVNLTWNRDGSVNLTVAGRALEAVRKWPEPYPDLPRDVPLGFLTDS